MRTDAGRLPSARRRLPDLLHRNVPFRHFWTGQTISLFGDQITLIALPLVAVLELHAGPAEMGYLTAANLLPNLLFSIHAGAWIDRRAGRRRVMIAADLGRAALLVTIPLAAWLGVLSMAQLYVVAFALGSFTVLFWVSYNAIFAALLEHDDYMTGSALLNGSRAVSFMAGMSLGGALVQALTAPFALIADAVSFMFSAWFMRASGATEPPPEPGTEGGVTAGIRWLSHHPIMRADLAATATINLFNFMFFALFILYATRDLQVTPAALGLVLGAAAVGSIIGSLITGALQRRIGVGPAFALGCLLFPAPLLLVPLAGGSRAGVLAMLFLAEFGSGLGVMILDITGGAIMAALIPEGLRSRVSGAFMVVNYGVRPVGSLAGGALGAWLGLRPALWIATAGAMLGVLWLLPSPVMRLRELPRQGDDTQNRV
ncbi:MAG TPA: MFS transporter [Gaiellales bacterium]|nr:MFS transporter [Gaiellales bacterium]